MVVGLPVVAVVGGSIKLGQAVRLSWWAALTLLGVAGYAVLKSPERRAVLGRSLWPVVETLGEAMADAAAREEAGVQQLKATMFMPCSPPTAKQQVATVLARAPMPLSLVRS